MDDFLALLGVVAGFVVVLLYIICILASLIITVALLAVAGDVIGLWDGVVNFA